MFNFASENRIAEIAAMIGDVSRSAILCVLMDGRAFTAGELASFANISPPTASAHLGKLTAAGLITCLQQGRHRYYRIASSDVADVLEALSVMAAAGPKSFRAPGPKDQAMRRARSCYDHLAGHLAVTVADALERQGHIHLADGAASVSDSGRRFFCDFGLDLEALPSGRRELCRACLDWSQRRYHIGGRLGAALLEVFLDRQWLRRTQGSRGLTVTRAGEAGFAREFGAGQLESVA
jgi:DNA-binding transcriptional ArsR family regulator